MTKSFANIDTASLTQAFLASGGAVQHCPTKIVGPTRAKLHHRWSDAGKQEQAELDNANGLRE